MKFYFDLNSQRNIFLADLVLLNDGTQRVLSHSTWGKKSLSPKTLKQ